MALVRDRIESGGGASLRGRWDRIAAQVVLSGLGATVALMGGAMWLYPGGTWLDPEAAGHAFWGNFWCDLLRSHALNGVPNPWASQLAFAAMVTFAGALLAFWVVVKGLLASRCWARWVVGLGWLSGAAVVVVGLTPSDRFPQLHSAAIVVAGSMFVLAMVGASVGFWQRGKELRHATWLALLVLPLTVLNLVQYASQVYSEAHYAPWLPGAQKLATLCVALWVGTVSALALRSAEQRKA